MGPLHATLAARTRHYDKLARLRGKLNLMTKQIRARPEEAAMDTTKEALLGKEMTVYCCKLGLE